MERMKEAQTYRQYAADCRRMAEAMSAKDKSTLIKMAEAWDVRADEAARQKKAQSSKVEE
jgi:hypothetical protein